MPHYIAFLRGINLGKRRLSMEELRGHFEKLGFSDVATFIASGNVIFRTKRADVSKLEKQIEAHLAKSLSYEVETFLRTTEEVGAAGSFQPFRASGRPSAGDTVHVGFLKQALDDKTARTLSGIRTDVDEFCVRGRELYWLCRIKSHESKVWASAEMKALKLPTLTMRNLNTVQKLAGLYPVAAAR